MLRCRCLQTKKACADPVEVAERAFDFART